MSYLRADDSLDANPKILALGNDQRRYTWVRILLYSIRFASPEIPPNISETVPKATRAFLKICADIGLIDTDENTGTMRVHDWDEYNGVVAEQREKWKESKRTQRGQPKDKPRTEQGQHEDEKVDSRVGARSHVPFPSPLSTSSSQSSRGLEDSADETDRGSDERLEQDQPRRYDGGNGYEITGNDLPPELQPVGADAARELAQQLDAYHHREDT